MQAHWLRFPKRHFISKDFSLYAYISYICRLPWVTWFFSTVRNMKRKKVCLASCSAFLGFHIVINHIYISSPLSITWHCWVCGSWKEFFMIKRLLKKHNPDYVLQNDIHILSPISICDQLEGWLRWNYPRSGEDGGSPEVAVLSSSNLLLLKLIHTFYISIIGQIRLQKPA